MTISTIKFKTIKHGALETHPFSLLYDIIRARIFWDFGLFFLDIAFQAQKVI